MGLFKILGGAALGVAALVAAPVFGAIGTITLVGAAVGAAAGAAAGGISSALEKDESEGKASEAYARGKAERAAEVQNLQAKLAAATQRFATHKALEEFTLAAFAIGVAAAHADGSFSAEERTELEEIVAGEAYRALPEALRAQVQKLYQAPPDLATAMQIVKRVPETEWASFDAIIELVISSDDVIHPGEAAFRQQWQALRAEQHGAATHG